MIENKKVFFSSIPISRTIFFIILVAVVLRTLHLLSALSNPMSFHLGADEEYYYQFALEIMNGSGGLVPEFVFMDPLYGYLLAAIFLVFGNQIIVIFSFQVLLDTLTVWMVYLLGKKIWSYQAGLVGAATYALSSTAILFTTSLSKPTLTASFIVFWLYLIILLKEKKLGIALLGFGIFLGFGIALRANLLLLAFAAVFLLNIEDIKRKSIKTVFKRTSLLAIGLSIPLFILSYRFYVVTGNWSFIPNNGGVVLHQLYNSENPNSIHSVPGFVNFKAPSEIWKAYEAEANKRHSRELKSTEVNHYWRSEAINYFFNNFTQSMLSVFRKLFEFSSYKEPANNRTIIQEEYFSPILANLPRPFGFLFIFGVSGFILLFIRKNYFRWEVLAPVFVTLFTVSVFFMLSRFRFHIVPIFALGTGIFISYVIEQLKLKAWDTVAYYVVICLFLTTITIASSNNVKETRIDWLNVTWGTIKRGDVIKAKELIDKHLIDMPDTESLLELKGYLALIDEEWNVAINIYSSYLKEDSKKAGAFYNYAFALEKLGNYEEALVQAKKASQRNNDPSYAYKVGELYELGGYLQEAIEQFQAIVKRQDIAASNQYKLKSKNRLIILKNGIEKSNK